ncbi:Crp/Fnr family transcriptional regulator [Halioglobus maricola]|uniref:Crp/Fnr family transcriptional regulator n=1 Tax=Halioglobus maricola TaxID=2601894 RepID=A0A5P9NLR2_9GAMM|nr:Crp/Fnr family transcriptional regulator [Halioglobus maricola]QFU76445.1 Crp/Fnr family transcriptional regulator [Halioglobus maricola]
MIGRRVATISVTETDSGSARTLVSDSPWFQGLPDAALEQLVAAAQIKEVASGSYIYQQGQPTTEVFCIVTGRVRVSLFSPNGHEFALVEREPGTWFGEPGLVNDEGRVIEARAIEPTRLLVISREVVLRVGAEHPRMYENLFRYSQGILRGLHELVGGILFYPLKARVAGRLLHLCQEHGVPNDGGVSLDIKVTQNDFARLALGSRQRVNRVFRDWANRNLVETREDHLWVRDLEELEQEIDLFE